MTLWYDGGPIYAYIAQFCFKENLKIFTGANNIKNQKFAFANEANEKISV